MDTSGDLEVQESEALVNFFPVGVPAKGTNTFVYSVSFEPEDVVPLSDDKTKLRIALVYSLEKTSALVCFLCPSRLLMHGGCPPASITQSSLTTGIRAFMASRSPKLRQGHLQ